MSQEKPLKGIGEEIAEYLDACPNTVRNILNRYKVPTFKIGRYTCCYASTLKKCMEGTYRYNDDPSTDHSLTPE